MEQRFAEKLEGVENRFGQKLEGVEQGFGRKLDGLEQRFGRKLDDLEQRSEQKFDEKLNALDASLREHTENVETRLLSEFWKWARTSDIKTRQYGADISSLIERITVVEERLRDLEFRRPA